MMHTERYQKLAQGYARLLDSPLEAFFANGLRVINTSVRNLPEWRIAFEEAVICSVSSIFANAAKEAFAEVTAVMAEKH